MGRGCCQFLTGNSPGKRGRGPKCQVSGTFGVGRFSPCHLGCLSGTVSAQGGAPRGGDSSPPAVGHGQSLLWGPAAEAPRDRAMVPMQGGDPVGLGRESAQLAALDASPGQDGSSASSHRCG